ncbi:MULTISPECIES: hypothetical protein [Klebsiella]|uniref:hypothetical protein n=1 Tax=Klebsiella TaxID=570 RepID=UPI0010E8C242|nr:MULTISPECIES: hypothetical protein [Klebsiella]VGP89292.1 hypothetical protein SB5544_02370 [Klebsiella variicola]
MTSSSLSAFREDSPEKTCEHHSDGHINNELIYIKLNHHFAITSLEQGGKSVEKWQGWPRRSSILTLLTDLQQSIEPVGETQKKSQHPAG